LLLVKLLLSAALILDQGSRAVRMDLQNETITALLAKRDESTFEQVFKTHFKSLHAYAFTILKDPDEAEEVVQQVFFRLWERSENLSIEGPVAAYLYRAVHNESLNLLKHEKVKSTHRLHVAYSMKNETDQASKKLAGGELEKKLHAALNELPEQCRTIFQLSRFNELKYREIADRLGISIKTVENQMGKALKLLRVKLVDFLPFILLFFTT
jgi:RNA polymerase sigma-70 factor (ECF subfamily)